MTAWRRKCAGHEVWINNVDHLPPHCHVRLEGRVKTVNLYTLEISDPPPHRLPPRLRRVLKASQAELLEAWDSVRVIPPGSDTRSW